MIINEKIKEILQTMPNDLEISDKLKKVGVTKEIKLAYYLYKQITKELIEADIDFHIADEYEQKRQYFKKNYDDLTNNRVLCKHINQAYQQLLNKAIQIYKEKGINLDIKSQIIDLHPENEITHSDIILICNGRPVFCNPILDLLESKAEYRIRYFARALKENPYPDYQERLKNIFGPFFSITPENIEQLDTEIGQDFKKVYRNEFEDQVFEEFANSKSDLKENIKKEDQISEIKYTESGLYPYLKSNKEKYKLDDKNNLQKSKVDFILDNLSYITSDTTKINVLSKYLYYYRLIKRLFEQSSIGDYNIFTCKYKNGNPKDVELLLLLELGDNRFSYLLSSNEKKFCEVPIEQLKSKIKDNKNPLVLYKKPYQIQTGPLTKEESNEVLKKLDRDEF